MQEKVDAIVLGYGRCQAMDRLGENFKVPVLRPQAEDCIGVLLGQDQYEEELRRVPGDMVPVSGLDSYGNGICVPRTADQPHWQERHRAAPISETHAGWIYPCPLY